MATEREKIADELKEALPDLIEEFFPKGKCQERGKAMVLGAMLIMKIKEPDNVTSSKKS